MKTLLYSFLILTTALFILPAQGNQEKEQEIQGNLKPDDAYLRENLTELQYEVTQNKVTEAPFDNEYWNNQETGIYVDIVSGEPLFSTTDQFLSISGWPSFTQPIEKEIIIEKVDKSYGMLRTEVRSLGADSHLGHVFEDGPAPTSQRYCINSASLRFIPKEEMEAEGYGDLLYLFE